MPTQIHTFVYTTVDLDSHLDQSRLTATAGDRCRFFPRGTLSTPEYPALHVNFFVGAVAPHGLDNPIEMLVVPPRTSRSMAPFLSLVLTIECDHSPWHQCGPFPCGSRPTRRSLFLPVQGVRPCMCAYRCLSSHPYTAPRNLLVPTRQMLFGWKVLTRCHPAKPEECREPTMRV